jgi:excisionase family DNA binding protein
MKEVLSRMQSLICSGQRARVGVGNRSGQHLGSALVIPRLLRVVGSVPISRVIKPPADSPGRLPGDGLPGTSQPARRNPLPLHVSFANNGGRAFSVQQIACRFQVNQQTVRNWVSAGKLPEVRVGRRVRIRASDLDEFVGGSEKPPRKHALRLPHPEEGMTGRLSSSEVEAVGQIADLLLAWAARLDEGSTMGQDLAELGGRLLVMSRRLSRGGDSPIPPGDSLVAVYSSCPQPAATTELSPQHKPLRCHVGSESNRAVDAGGAVAVTSEGSLQPPSACKRYLISKLPEGAVGDCPRAQGRTGASWAASAHGWGRRVRCA